MEKGKKPTWLAFTIKGQMRHTHDFFFILTASTVERVVLLSRHPLTCHEVTSVKSSEEELLHTREVFFAKEVALFLLFSFLLEPHLNFILCDNEDIIHKVPYNRPGV